MVATGHSKGCGTCRRRKVKCGRLGIHIDQDWVLLKPAKLVADEQKPHCQRCQRARIVCEGYAKVFKWIDEGKLLNLVSTMASNSSQQAQVYLNRNVETLLEIVIPPRRVSLRLEIRIEAQPPMRMRAVSSSNSIIAFSETSLHSTT